MKKLILLVFAFGLFACTPTALEENDRQIETIDKDKVCPPGQPNC